ncbi:MAG: 5'-nucleotidase C-terminal domain-containing protein [Gammaproteobacteria bacterium]
MKLINPCRIKTIGKAMSSLLAMSVMSMGLANAANMTIIQVSDLHGNLVPHAGIIEEWDPVSGTVTERVVTQGGGITKVATVVNDIRATSDASVTLGVGDSLHGSAEVLFTMGDAIMPAFNALGLDAYTPGNWEFAYGPAVFRNRFSKICKANANWQFPGPGGNPGPGTPGVLCPVIPPNARIMTDSDGQTGVVQANFDTLAVNLYNGGPYPLQAPFFNKRTLDPYKIIERNGVKMAIVGITAAIIPQQPPVFGRTFRFTQGVEELPGIISEIKDQGVEIIVIQSELGLPQNVQIGREFPDVDVVLSAHSHELTIGALLADADGVEMAVPGAELTANQLARLQKGAAVIVEAGEDLYVGRLDLKITDNKVQNFTWNAVPVDDSVPEDEYVASLVYDQEKYFVDGPDFKPHSFLPFAFCNGYAPGKFDPVERCGGNVETRDVARGLRLTDSLDLIVGETEVLLHRHEALEGTMNNVIADAFRHVLADSAKAAGPASWANLDVLSMTNGFRFDTPVLPADMIPEGAEFGDGRMPGEMTQRDLWGYFPVAAALVASDYSGVTIQENLNNILANVFSPNPYIQRGGWYLGLSSNMTQKVDVVRLPGSTSGSRIIETRVGGELMDPSKRYIIASCYGHTFPIGRSCRAEGGTNMLFANLNNGDDYTSGFNFIPPLATEGLIDNHPGRGGVAARAAPDNYLHPVHALRLYMDYIGTITEAEYGHGAGHRVEHVNAFKVVNGAYEVSPLPESNLPGIVQPIDGVGPGFLERGVIVK